MADVAAATGGALHGEGAGEGVVTTDSRTAGPGSIFVALVGDRFDGHDFAAHVQGAVGGVFSKPVEGWRGAWVEVVDTTRALQDLGRWARRRLRCPVVGLTGSNGKTTTRALTAAALAQCGEVHQTQGNLNNHLGVPLTLLATPEDADVVVLEMGTSSPGEIALLADIGAPDVRLIVNVGPAHLLELGGLPGVAREKRALFDSARPGDVIVVNADDPYLADAEAPRGRVLRWGRGEDVDVQVLDAALDPETLTTRGVWRLPGGAVVATTLGAPGAHVAHNAGGALAVAAALGLDLVQAAADLARFAPVGMRLRSTPVPGGVVAINDAYNANPASMKSTIDVVASLPGRRALVLGDMLELGPGEAAFHAEIAQYAAAAGVELVVLVGPRMSEAPVSDVGPSTVLRFVDPIDAVTDLDAWLRSGDHVAFKGSRGARVERALEGLIERRSTKSSEAFA
jgi:UDP-N-acetylmuramoyl-tripeptide--D-alanyl-D-alanine ligase